ncbi:winged helix DNA-binding protein [Priestia megaterium]
MRPQSIGELLSKLERKGYIVRTPSEKDRRVLSVELTEAGLEAIEATEEQDNNSGIFDVLSEEEQDTLSHLMQKLNTYLDEEMLKQGHDENQEFRRHNDLRGFGPHHRFLVAIQSMVQEVLGADLGETVLNLEHRDLETEIPERLIEIITRNDSHAV